MNGIQSFNDAVLRTPEGRAWANRVIETDHRLRSDVHAWLKYAVDHQDEFALTVTDVGLLRDVFRFVVYHLHDPRLIAEYRRLAAQPESTAADDEDEEGQDDVRASDRQEKTFADYAAFARLLERGMSPVSLFRMEGDFVPGFIEEVEGIRRESGDAKLPAFVDMENGQIILGRRRRLSHVGLALFVREGLGSATPPLLKMGVYGGGARGHAVSVIVTRGGPFGEVLDEAQWSTTGRRIADAFWPHTRSAALFADLEQVTLGDHAAAAGASYFFVRGDDAAPLPSDGPVIRAMYRTASSLHLRPAAALIQAAMSFRDDGTQLSMRRGTQEVSISNGGILSLTMLAIQEGELVELIARGPRAQALLDKVSTLPPFVAEEEDPPPKGQGPSGGGVPVGGGTPSGPVAKGPAQFSRGTQGIGGIVDMSGGESLEPAGSGMVAANGAGAAAALGLVPQVSAFPYAGGLVFSAGRSLAAAR